MIATVIELNSCNQYVIDLIQSISASKERNIASELVNARMVKSTNRYTPLVSDTRAAVYVKVYTKGQFSRSNHIIEKE